MVGDDAERHVDLALLVGVIRWKCTGVLLPAKPFQLAEDWREGVGFVVGDSSREILQAVRALDHRADSIETHARIHVLGRQRRECAIGIRIELDKHEVPDLDAQRRARVDEFRAAVARGRKIDMDFATRAARAGVAHHPEIVFAVTGKNVVVGQMPPPQIACFVSAGVLSSP